MTTAKDAVRLPKAGPSPACRSRAGDRGRDRSTRGGCARGCLSAAGRAAEARAAPRARGRGSPGRLRGGAPAAAPRRAGYRRRLGRLWAALDPRHLAIAEANLRPAFPDWDEARLQATARGVYAHFGDGAARPALDGGAPRPGAARAGRRRRPRAPEGALAAGLASSPPGHFGNWEFQGVTSAPLIGPSSVVARPLDNPALDRRLVALRAATGNIVIYKQRALPEVLRNLREGRVVGDRGRPERPGEGRDLRALLRSACLPPRPWRQRSR